MNLPNKLTLLRIIMIPVFVVLLYLDFPFNNLVALAVFILASITDTLDGYIARHFNMITNLGKVLDPVADKLTQGVVAFCLCVKIPTVIPLLVLLVFKELFMSVAGIWVLKRTGKPFGAFWWGKVSTTIYYIAIIILVLGETALPYWAILLLVWTPFAALLFSLIMYCKIYIKILHNEEPTP